MKINWKCINKKEKEKIKTIKLLILDKKEED
jgi:hypothetical protein